MVEKKNLLKATGVMGAATLLSRCTGLVRDIVVARVFGAGLMTDAFFMAFTIPNLLRRFFAEGSLTAAFVPVFSRVHKDQGTDQARRLASICATTLVITMAGITLLGIICSPWIVKAIGYGFGGVEGKLALTDQLNRLMFPYLFLVSLLALFTGVLNVLGHFFWPSISPVFLNLAMIVCAWTMHPLFDVPIFALAVGVLVGGLLQLVLQLPVLHRYQFIPRFAVDFTDPALRKIGRLMIPGIAGVAIYQINVVVTRLLASFLEQGSVTWLYYGQRLFEFPQGIFVVSLAQAFLPTISRHAAAGEIESLKESLRYALSLILIVTIPATVGLILCAAPVYDLFFLGGQFSSHDVAMSAMALVAYAPGLVCVGITQILVRTFYGLEDMRTPVWISAITLVVNAVAGLLLMQTLGHVGLALALTLSAACNAVLLGYALHRKVGCYQLKKLGAVLARIALPTFSLFVVVKVLLLGWDAQDDRTLMAIRLLIAVGAGGLVYGGVALVCGVSEVNELWQKLRHRWRKA